MKYSLPILCILSLSLVFGFVSDVSTSAFSCSQMSMIFARGSGQPLEDDEWDRISEGLKKRLENTTISLSTYEVGTTHQNGYKYPAVNVDDVFNGNATGAWISAGNSNDYGNSVRDGVNELVAYVEKTNRDCPDTKFVLAGYSQGAQVIGDYLKRLDIVPNIRDKVIFAALFGDPKLHLPEGEGWFPPACRNEQFSTWRRDIGDCNTDNGSLGARKPYVPESMKHKTGTWCLENDFVCGSSKFLFIRDGHGKYADADSSIDKAILEISKLISKEFTTSPTDPDPSPPPLVDLRIRTEDLKGADVMILIDRTLPASHMPFLNEQMTDITSKTIQSGGRVGHIVYCSGCFFGTSHRPLAAEYYYSFSFLSSFGHTATPEATSAALRGAISLAQQDSWRQGAKHLIAIFTATPYQQDLELGKTFGRAKLAADQSLLVPNWHLYPVTPSEVATSYNVLTAQNSLTHQQTAGTMEEAAAQFSSSIDSQLDAELSSTSYRAMPGNPLTFSASPSRVYNDTITKYLWDFTNDGAVDSVTTLPQAYHTYTQAFTGEMSVQATTSGGLVDKQIAKVTISEESDKQIAAPHSLQVKSLSVTKASFSWKPSDPNVVGWVVYVNDVPIARLPPERLSINISELDLNNNTTFGIAALDPQLQLGEQAIATFRGGSTVSTVNTGALVKSEKLGRLVSASASSLHASQLLWPTAMQPISRSDTPFTGNQTSFWHLLTIGVGALATLSVCGVLLKRSSKTKISPKRG